VGKIKVLTVLGLYSHISAPMDVKFGKGKRTYLRSAPPRVKIFGPLSKNNTGMAARRNNVKMW